MSLPHASGDHAPSLIVHESHVILSHGWLNMQFVANYKRLLQHCTGCQDRRPASRIGQPNRMEPEYEIILARRERKSKRSLVWPRASGLARQADARAMKTCEFGRAGGISAAAHRSDCEAAV